jgi:transposase
MPADRSRTSPSGRRRDSRNGDDRDRRAQAQPDRLAVDAQGRRLAERTIGATSNDHLELLAWAACFAERRWAVEDCRDLSRRLERDLLAAGERLVRVPPKLMAYARDAARSFGKSDPIDGSRLPALHCASPTFRSPSSTGPSGKCACS